MKKRKFYIYNNAKWEKTTQADYRQWIKELGLTDIHIHENKEEYVYNPFGYLVAEASFSS